MPIEQITIFYNTGNTQLHKDFIDFKGCKKKRSIERPDRCVVAQKKQKKCRGFFFLALVH